MIWRNRHPIFQDILFENMGSTPLYEAVLDGKDVCLHSLPEPPSESMLAMKLPPIMRV